uniref:Dipeptide epimerase n=1 Tax=Fervidicoccus fontis TaxID=683846 RepID=A0A7J3ZJJ6_9CREN
MIVEEIRVYRYAVPLKGEYKTSFEASVSSEGLIVVLKSSGLEGYGEASPTPKIAGSTPRTSLEAIKHLAQLVVGRDLALNEFVETIDNSLLYNSDARAALEAAFIDLWCKERGMPVYRYFGGSRREFVTDITVGTKDVEDTVWEASRYAEEGFEYLKVKLGEGYPKDVERVRALRAALGYDVNIKVDANQAWSLKEAIRIARALERYEVELIEQPLPFWMLEEHSILRQATEIPIALDESVHTARDALRAIREGAADVINIKLMKAGGFLESLRIAQMSEVSGVKNMVGCMLETRLGITIASHLVGVSKNVEHVDLDSDLFLQWDPVSGGAEHLGGGRRRLSEEPGWGVRVDLDKLELLFKYGES